MLTSSSALFEEMKDGVIPGGDFRTGMCGVEVTVGDFMVAEVRIGAGMDVECDGATVDGSLATEAAVSEMEAFLTDVVPVWVLDLEVCPVGCFVSS